MAEDSAWNRSIRFSQRVSRQLFRIRKGNGEEGHGRVNDRMMSFSGVHPKLHHDLRIRMDPIYLLCHLPLTLSSAEVAIVHNHFLKKSLGVGYRMELRGGIVLLRNQEKCEYLTDIGNDVEAIFSVTKCQMKRTNRTIRLKRDGSSVVLGFRTDEDVDAWEKEFEKLRCRELIRLSDFKMVSAIGQGAGGKVFLVQEKATKRYYALKTINKREAVFSSESAFRHLVDERILLERVRGIDGFCQLAYAFQTRSSFCIVTSFYEGGDLFNHLYHQQASLDISQAKIAVSQIIVLIEKLHDFGFLYRDLKPENILLDARGHVHLADFGLCKYFPEGFPDGKTDSVCGTPAYAAPEMLDGCAYGRSVDIYSLGVFLFHLLVGQLPFEIDKSKSIRTNLEQRKEPNFKDAGVSEAAMDLMSKLMEQDPDRRLDYATMSLDEVKQSKFFEGTDWSAVQRRDVPGIVMEDVEEFFDEEARLLRNFNVTDFQDVQMELDDDDEKYGESKLWPLCLVKKGLVLDPGYLPGFLYMPKESTAVMMDTKDSNS